MCGGNRGWYSVETQQILMTLFRTASQQGVDAVAIMIDLLRSQQRTIAPLAMPSPASQTPKPPGLLGRFQALNEYNKRSTKRVWALS